MKLSSMENQLWVATQIRQLTIYADYLNQGKDIDTQVDATLDRLLVEFGKEILKIVPGKVSTEVDARFSFDTKASVEKALHIIDVRLSICCRVLHLLT